MGSIPTDIYNPINPSYLGNNIGGGNAMGAGGGMSFILPAAMGLGSLLSGLFSGSQQRNMQQQQLDLQRQLQNWQMQFAQQQFGAQQQGNWWDRWAAMLPKFNSSEYGSTTTTHGNSTTTSHSKTLPVITQPYQGLNTLAKNIITSRLSSPFGSLPDNYKAAGVRTANQAFDQVNAALGSNLASRGLSTSPAGGNAAAAIEAARGGSIADFLSQVPLKEKEAQTSDLNIANQMTQLFGLGSETNASSNTEFGQVSGTEGWQNALSGVIPMDASGMGIPSSILNQFFPNGLGTGAGASAGMNGMLPGGMPFPTNMNDLMAMLLGHGSTVGSSPVGGAAGALRSQYA